MRALWRAWLMALLVTPLASPSLAAAEPPPNAPEPVPAPVPPPPGPALTVVVTRVDPTGAALRADGAEVTLELVSQSMRSREGRIDGAYLARTDATGRARFAGVAPLEPGQRYRAHVRYRDVAWPPEDVPRLDEPVHLVVYSPGGDRARLRLAMHVIIQPSEGRLIVREQLRLINPTLHVIDLDDSEGLRVPLLLPAVAGDPVDLGLVPVRPDPQRLNAERTPAVGRLVFERGGLFYRGPVPPGEELVLTVSYGLPYDDARTNYPLGVRPPLDVDRFVVQVAHGDRLAPRVVPRQDFVAMTRRLPEARERIMTLTSPPTAGQVVLFDIEHLPTRRPLNTAIAVYGTIAFGLLFLLGVLYGLRRTRER